jgi:2-iminobutanoate/2-iminopropanoate deaminase
MTKQVINSTHAPHAVGPYSHAIRAGGFVFISGQLPIDPASGKLIDSPDIDDHVRRILDNLKAILEAAGSDLEHAVKTTVYLADIEDFPEVNRAYAMYFSEAPPARATVEASALPLGARLQIDMIALCEQGAP